MKGEEMTGRVGRMDGMGGLAEFLLARIAEDEAVARQAASAKPGAHYSDASQVGAVWSADDGMVVGADDLWEDEGADSLAMDPAAAAHVARHDPARVLAKCEADRRVVDYYASLRGLGAYKLEERQTLADVLRLLALPYADHPGYREEWRP